jgi:small subunit ribosomal protein S16
LVLLSLELLKSLKYQALAAFKPNALRKSEIQQDSAWQVVEDLPISAPALFLGTPQSFNTMAVSIRLNRKGTKDRPYYKIVAVDSRKRRDGRFIEQLGTYDPLLEGTNFTIDLAIADKWLAVGAKPSETVNSMIRKARTAAAAQA